MNTDILFQNHKIILWIYFLEISKFSLQIDLQIADFNHYSFEQTIISNYTIFPSSILHEFLLAHRATSTTMNEWIYEFSSQDSNRPF